MDIYNKNRSERIEEGSEADCQQWIRNILLTCEKMAFEEGRQPYMNTNTAAVTMICKYVGGADSSDGKW